MREFVILVQSMLLRPASADAAPAPAIGLIAPAADLHEQASFFDTAIWLSRHLSGGMALVLLLLATLMLQVLIRKRPLPSAFASSRARVPALPRRYGRPAPEMRRTASEDRTASVL
ncbi:MAG TPA: hypothetical protein VHC39_08390 [Rhizomicrobium sp.]|nr:hypothetical protein [Rhizomicrobium sp.]